MQKTFKTEAEVDTFVNPMLDEDRFIIEIDDLVDGSYLVKWQEHKTYVAVDGIEYPDEIWVTKDDQLLQIQDIEPEHCRNILRMILRNGRESGGMLGQSASSENTADIDQDEFYNIQPISPTLH